MTTPRLITSPTGSFGQGLSLQKGSGGQVHGEDPGPGSFAHEASPWEHFVLGLEESFEQTRQEFLDRSFASGPNPGGEGREEPSVPGGPPSLGAPADRRLDPKPVKPARAIPATGVTLPRVEEPLQPREREEAWSIPVAVSWGLLTLTASDFRPPCRARRVRRNI
ncbi:MAG: hypothetical protein JO244_12975 [Solirubrobacterales bacterium]|nr:hypothetical protein [Solirubrobacterales bacterium]